MSTPARKLWTLGKVLLSVFEIYSEASIIRCFYLDSLAPGVLHTLDIVIFKELIIKHMADKVATLFRLTEYSYGMFTIYGKRK